MSKDVYVSREIERNGSKSVLEVNHSMRTLRSGWSKNTTLRLSGAVIVPKHKLAFIRSNLRAKGYQDLGSR